MAGAGSQPLRLVLDTNIVVTGLLWNGPPRRLIELAIVGEAVDSLIFYPLAFAGVWPKEQVIAVMMSNYMLKVGWEVVNTPITYRVVRFLKKAESEDYYDRGTNFTPFSLEA